MSRQIFTSMIVPGATLEEMRWFNDLRIGVTKDELTALGQRALIPRMLAEAFIETETHTVLSYLLKPISDRLAYVFRER